MALAGLLRRLANREEDQSQPWAVVSDPEVELLSEQARCLASEGRDDANAVQVLREAAAGHPGRLRRAAALVRLEGTPSEDRVDHLANRLLLAAAEDRAVEPPSSAELRWFSQIEALESAPLAESFGVLRGLQPGLAPLEAEVRASPAAFRSDAGWDELCERLAGLLGPDSDMDDRVGRSRTAYGLARIYLAQLAGVALD